MIESQRVDVNFVTAFPKSGITFLNYMLFPALFDQETDRHRIDSDFIIDIHEHLNRVPGRGDEDLYVKSHFCYGPALPLRDRAKRAVQLVRDPIDVMMSLWDFKHLTGSADLTDGVAFDRFVTKWLSTGGLEYEWAGSWLDNVNSWLEQVEIPTLVVRYELLKARPVEELARVLAFLNRPVSSGRLATAVEAGRVDRMRQDEASEVEAGIEGAFYRHALAAGYAKGYRFVGRLHEGADRTVLTDEQRAQAQHVFGPTLARVRALAGFQPSSSPRN
jgi:hypothetical protein